MSLVTAKPTLIENHFYTFFSLQPDRMGYYLAVIRTTRNIFIDLGLEEKNEQLDSMIKNLIEIPYKTSIVPIMDWYYNPKNYFKMKVFFKVGDRIDYVKVTKYEVKMKMEQIKEWCYNEISMYGRDVRFTAIMPIQQ